MARKRLLAASLGIFLLLLIPMIGVSDSGDQLYESARSKYQQFSTDEDAKSNRANWLNVISAFERVYQTYPNSGSAPKSYFMAGKLSYYSFKYHRNKADFDRGVRNLNELIRHYSGNPLADDAYYYLGELYLKAGLPKDAGYYYACAIRKYPGGDMNRDARQRLQQLKYWPIPQWLTVYKPGASGGAVEPRTASSASSPQPASTTKPASPVTAAATKPAEPAAKPGAQAAKPAEPAAKPGTQAAKPVETPKPAVASVSAVSPKPLPGDSSTSSAASSVGMPGSSPSESDYGTGRVLIKEIKFFSSISYTRVIVHCKNKVAYGNLSYLPPDPQSGIQYPRMFLDIKDARLGPGVGQPKDVNDGILRRIRAGQNAPDVVRVVLDIESIDPKKTKVIPMEASDGDFRLVIDAMAIPKRNDDPTKVTPLQTIAEDRAVRKIVVDPGHGGNDPGAVGPTGLQEKEVVLKLAQKLVHVIEDSNDIEVLLTRDSDRYLSLEERTAFANVANADIFISIHANAHPNPDARGIETYLLDTTNDQAAKRLAAVENRVSMDALDEFQKDPLLFTLFQKAKADESFDLARITQKNMIDGLRKDYTDIFDHGVREAPFFVLMGATMPCILIETSFITNPFEEKRLALEDYIEALAKSIGNGIFEYSKWKQDGHGGDM